MKLTEIGILTVMMAWSVVAEEAITLSGIVTDPSAQPVAGAVVTVHNQPEYSAVTDASGKFSIASVAVRMPQSRVCGISSGAVLNGNNLYVARNTGGAVKLDLYTAAGKRVVSHSIDRLSDAGYTWTLPVVAEGLYVLNVTVNGSVASFKQFFASHRTLSVEKRELVGTQGGTSAHTAAFSSDSLVAVAKGFVPMYLPLTSYTAADLAISFDTPTTQWQPAGAVENVGNMKKIKAKGTSFAMGQPVMVRDDDGPWSFEQPVHVVSFTYDYLIDSTEVTQKQYVDVMKDMEGFAASDGWNTTYGIGDNIAAHHISISDAMLFCNERSKKEGLDTVYTWTTLDGTPGRKCTLAGVSADCTNKGYRLPTEEEWEYACRGGSVTDYYWNKNYRAYPATAEDTTEMNMYALWYGNAGRIINTDPNYGVKPGAASKLPNSYGLYDMVGGCMEWVHITNFTFAGPLTDPMPEGALDINSATVISPRGGNFDNHPINLRSASRKPRVGNYPYCYWGFRSVKEVQ